MPSAKTMQLQKLLDCVEFEFIQGPQHAGTLTRVLEEFVALGEPLGLDTETTGLDPLVNQVRLIQLGTRERAVVVDLDGWRTEGQRQVDWECQGLRELRDVIGGSTRKVLQNATFDLNFLHAEGLFIGGQIFDTMMASKVIYNGQMQYKNDLGSIIERLLKVTIPKELQKANWGAELTDEMLKYSARDVVALAHIGPILRQKLQNKKTPWGTYLWDVYTLESSCLRPVSFMQAHGFKFDTEGAQMLERALEAKAEGMKIILLEHLEQRLQLKYPKDTTKWLPRHADGTFNTNEKDSGSIRLGTKVLKGFNPRSAQQMAQKLEDAGIELRPGEKGKPSMDQNLLAFVRKHPGFEIVDEYLEWKAVETQLSQLRTLLESVGPDGRIHASYRQMGTDTGRLSCAGPNLQQINRSKEFRSLFVAEDGYVLVVADFSQVELRVAGELSGEEKIIDAYLAGRDLHTETAALMAEISRDEVTKEQRQSAKVCFSGDTEVLTESGWVRLEAYSGEQVAQYVLPAGVELNRKVKKPGPGYVAGLPPVWDGNCGVLEFVEPLHFDSFISDDVWAVSDRNVDIIATGNHDIFYIDAYGNAFKRPLSEVNDPRLFLAGGYLKRCGELGEIRSRVLAMVVADGSFKQTPNWVTLGFSKRRKIHRCQELLEQAGIEYKRVRYSNGENDYTTFFKFRLQEADWLLRYVDVDKRLNFEACMRDVDALVYLAEAQYWDGLALEGAKRDRVIVGTVVQETADVMQAMAVTSGLPCTIHTEKRPELASGLFYKISYAFRTAPTWRPSWSPERVEAQLVYCVQVPSGLVLIRRNGKVCVQGNCNFGLLYGAGPATLQKQAVAQYGVDMDMNTAKGLVSGFREAYPTLYQWQQDTGGSTQPAIFTKIGRRRIIGNSFNDKYTTRINTEVQGTAGDIAKISISSIFDELGKRPRGEARLIAMCHDELVLEVREGTEEYWGATLKSAMETAGAQVCQKVPIVAEVSWGKTWADAK